MKHLSGVSDSHEESTADRKAKKLNALTGQDWRPSQVLAMGEALEQILKLDRTTAMEMVTEPGVPPKAALIMLETLCEQRAADRKKILNLYRTGDPSKQSLAKTRAMKLPPAVPATLGLLRDAIRHAERSLDDPFTTSKGVIRSAISQLREAKKANEKKYQELKKQDGF